MNWQQAADQVLVFVVWSFGISLSITMIVTALYSPVIYYKKLNVKRAKEIMEQNVQVVEEAIFFKSNTKFQEIIDNQLKEIKETAAEIDKAKKTLNDLQAEVTKASKK
ncbi:MAG: hypothetical protein QXM38_03515 [Candidatus Aenigmatarchaeota archaeon]